MFEAVYCDRNGLVDFGSSLHGLLNVAFDLMNNGRNSISELDALGRAPAAVQAFLGLGRALGLSVTAERVLTQSQLAMQTGNHCAEI